MNVHVYSQINELKGFSFKNCPAMPHPSGVLLCPPDHYDVVDVKNPFMAGKVGTVSRKRAREQWEGVREAFEKAGLKIFQIPPVAGLEDMTFCANQSFAGLNAKGEKVCLLSHMRHPSRRREVPAFEAWFKSEGYRIHRLKDSTALFEGMGDCRWHPGRRMLWGGYGFRTDPEVYGEIARLFGAPVVALKLVNERFYHLDTCFCPLTPEAVLIYPPAFGAESLEMILKFFPIVLTAEESEAVRFLPCNASVIASKLAIVQKGANVCIRHMKAVGLDIVEVDTSEFIKSGGSVFCMSMPLF